MKSPKGYRHIQKHNLLLLPSISLLYQLLHVLKCEYGINKHAIKSEFEGLNEDKRFGILIFDDIKLREGTRFKKSNLKLDGFVNLGEFTPYN